MHPLKLTLPLLLNLGKLGIAILFLFVHHRSYWTLYICWENSWWSNLSYGINSAGPLCLCFYQTFPLYSHHSFICSLISLANSLPHPETIAFLPRIFVGVSQVVLRQNYFNLLAGRLKLYFSWSLMLFENCDQSKSQPTPASQSEAS